MKRRRMLRLAAALGLACAMTGPAAAADDCAVPPDLAEVSVRLPHLARRLRAARPVRVVAVGGGSTRGAAARSADLAYPHRLQLALAEFFPGVPITVINKGAPRETAEEMLARFPTDVFALDPVLVVWETGTTDAVRGVELDDFAATLQAGIDQAARRGIDMVLVDMQFSHSTAAIIDFDRYLEAIRRVAELNGVYVLPRYDMMRYWSEQHVFNLDTVARAERARLAARVYDCIGRRLAAAIRLAVR